MHLLNDSYLEFIKYRVNRESCQRDKSSTPISKRDLDDAAALGFLREGLPESLGGYGRSNMHWGTFLEAVGYHCTDNSFALVVSLRAGLTKTLFTETSQAIKELAFGMTSGKYSPAFAFTDGTDAFSFNTTARMDAHGATINGVKHYVTGAASATHFMLYARNENCDSSDLSVVLVDRNSPGLSIDPVDLCGLRSAGISRMSLDDVHVPNHYIISENDGLSHVQSFLNDRRVFLVCALLGRMQAIFESCIDAVSRKIRYGNPLTEMQQVQSRFGRMRFLLETSRACLYRALQRMDNGHYDRYWDPIGSVCKLSIIDNAIELTHIAQRLMGGDGYLGGEIRWCWA